MPRSEKHEQSVTLVPLSRIKHSERELRWWIALLEQELARLRAALARVLRGR